MSYLPITSEISGQFLIRLHGKAEIVGALDGHFLVYFGDRTGFSRNETKLGIRGGSFRREAVNPTRSTARSGIGAASILM